MQIPSSLTPARRILSWLQDGLLRRLLKNSGWLLSGTGLATAIGLLSLTVKTRALGAEQFGLLTVVLAYITLVEKLTTFRSWVPLIKFGSKSLADGDHKGLTGTIKLSFIMDGLGAVAGFALAFSGAHLFASWQGWSSETTLLLSAASCLALFNLIDAPTGILRIFDKFRLFAAQKILEASLGLAGSLLSWWMGWGIWGFLVSSLFAIATGRVLLLILSFMILKSKGILTYWRHAPLSSPGPYLRFGWWSYLSAVMDVPVKQLDVIILSAALSLEASGVYRIIKQVVNMLALLTDPVYQAVYPQFSTLIAKGSFQECLKYCVKIGILIALLIAPVSVLMASTSYWWLGWVFGTEFRVAWFALSLFLLLKVLTLPMLPLHPLFTASGYVRSTVWILFVSNLIYLPSLWYLSREISFTGPVVAWFLQSCTVSGLKVLTLYRGRPSRKTCPPKGFVS